MSETTPLLGSNHGTRTNLDRLSNGLRTSIHSDSDAREGGATHHVYELATTLITFIALEKPQVSRSVINSWTATKERQERRTVLAERAEVLWRNLLDDAQSDADLSDVLWLDVPVEEGSNDTTRIIDLLAHPHCLETLVTHPVVELHAKDVWRNGAKASYADDNIVSLILTRYDRLATPRSIHLVDVLLQLAFTGLLLHYILDPPTPTVIQGYATNFGFRGVVLCIYSAAYLASKRTLQGIPFVLIFVAFTVALPAVPIPGDVAFDILLLAFIIHILLVHIPSLPTPLLLFPAQEALPLAILLWRSFAHTWLPILGFFLPVLLLATSLLSISLADAFLQTLPFVVISSPQAPMETRATFLTLYLLVLLIILTSLAMKVLVFSSTFLRVSAASARWDRYGPIIGLQARQVSLTGLIAYTARPGRAYPFPTPLNIVWLGVRLPGYIMQRVGWSGDRPRAERILWRGLVVPLTIIPTITSWLLERGSP